MLRKQEQPIEDFSQLEAALSGRRSIMPGILYEDIVEERDEDGYPLVESEERLVGEFALRKLEDGSHQITFTEKRAHQDDPIAVSPEMIASGSVKLLSRRPLK